MKLSKREPLQKKHLPVLGSSDNSIWIPLVVEAGNEHIRKVYNMVYNIYET